MTGASVTEEPLRPWGQDTPGLSPRCCWLQMGREKLGICHSQEEVHLFLVSFPHTGRQTSQSQSHHRGTTVTSNTKDQKHHTGPGDILKLLSSLEML